MLEQKDVARDGGKKKEGIPQINKPHVRRAVDGFGISRKKERHATIVTVVVFEGAWKKETTNPLL